MSVADQNVINKERHTFFHFIGIFIDSSITCLSLFFITYLQNEEFKEPFIILCTIAFSSMFPGRLYIRENWLLMLHRIILKWSFISTFIFLIGYTTKYIELYSTETLLLWFILTPVLLLASHTTCRILANYYYSLGIKKRTVVIVGCNNLGFKLGRSLIKKHIYGVGQIAFFDDNFNESIDLPHSSVVGNINDVVKFCNENDIDQVYICIPTTDQPHIINLLNSLKDTTASIYLSPNIFITDLIQSSLNHIDGIPVLAICETPLVGIKSIQKRLVDIVLSSLILLLVSPILVWIAYKVKLSSPGPILFVQKRYGLSGKEINVYKFRSMTVTEDGSTEYKQVVRNDPRVTPFGEFIRKTSLDELPQFINVLQGQMSIVGPRPHVVSVNESYRKLIPGYMIRHKVKPGITGWAQINGFRGGDDLESMQKRIEYDLEYLRIWSTRLDLMIIIRTALLFLSGDKNAH